MHTEVHQFIQEVRKKYPGYFDWKKVLEVGSLDINGSIRSYFTNCDYIGLDIGEGKGVDVVCPIHEFNPTRRKINEGRSAELILMDFSPDGRATVFPHYDVVVSTEMLEHDIHWRESLQRMYDLLKPQGLLILTCAGPNRQEHGTKRTTPGDSPFTTDYYRNIDIPDFESVLPKDLFDGCVLRLVRGATDLQFYGIKI